MIKMKASTSVIKTRIREAVSARKKNDTIEVKRRGRDILSVIRKNAVNDLETLEDMFVKKNEVAILEKLEKLEDRGEES